MLKVEYPRAQYQKELQNLIRDQVRPLSAELLNRVGQKTINYLLGHINKTRPPVRVGQPPRQARRGGWADVSGQLARSYFYQVTLGPEEHLLAVGNSAPYALELEQLDEYFVTRGIFDEGGPVPGIIREVAFTLGLEYVPD